MDTNKKFSECLIFNVSTWLVILLFYIIVTLSFNNKEVYPNSVAFKLLFLYLGGFITLMSFIIYFWNELIAFLKFIFSPNLYIVYSLFASIFTLIPLLTDVITFPEITTFIEKQAQIFIILIMLLPLILLIKTKNKKIDISTGTLYLVLSFILFLFFTMTSLKLPYIGTPKIEEGKLLGKDILYLAFMSLIHIFAGSLRLTNILKINRGKNNARN